MLHFATHILPVPKTTTHKPETQTPAPKLQYPTPKHKSSGKMDSGKMNSGKKSVTRPNAPSSIT